MAIVVVLHGLLVLIFTIRILLRNDLSPPARLAWFIVLNVIPYFGVAAYFLFGEVDIGKKSIQRHDEVFDEISGSAADFMGEKGAANRLIEPVYRQAFLYASSINGFHTVTGNSAELMSDGHASIQRMIEDIDAATDHVHVLYYIWLDDNTGRSLAEALIRAARRGVTCRAMADGLGSRALIKSALWQRMQEAGVQLAVALALKKPIRVMLTSRIDLRNHRKITVIDGRITYCGSRNSADPEFLPKARFAPWVDIMMRFTGPVVAQNQLLFASDWMQTTGESLDRFKLILEPESDGFPAQVMGFGPTERRAATPQLFSNLIASAQHELILSTPYFVPDATVLEALCAAAHRGVTVTLIYPRRNDSWIVAAVSHSYYHRLLGAGCFIHEYRDGLLHAKTLTIDGKVSLIGSTNLDLRSFDLNYENNILLYDPATTQSVVTRQLSYLDSSDAIMLSDVLAWPHYRNIWNNVIATIGPVL